MVLARSLKGGQGFRMQQTWSVNALDSTNSYYMDHIPILP
jgi:hypothetical protein